MSLENKPVSESNIVIDASKGSTKDKQSKPQNYSEVFASTYEGLLEDYNTDLNEYFHFTFPETGLSTEQSIKEKWIKDKKMLSNKLWRTSARLGIAIERPYLFGLKEAPESIVKEFNEDKPIEGKRIDRFGDKTKTTIDETDEYVEEDSRIFFRENSQESVVNYKLEATLHFEEEWAEKYKKGILGKYPKLTKFRINMKKFGVVFAVLNIEGILEHYLFDESIRKYMPKFTSSDMREINLGRYEVQVWPHE